MRKLLKVFGAEGSSDDSSFVTYLYKLVLHRTGPTSPQSEIPIYLDNNKVGTVLLPNVTEGTLYLACDLTISEELLKFLVPTLTLANSGYVHVELRVREVFDVSGVPIPDLRN